MQKFREVWDLITSVIRWGALAIGGICLLLVCDTAGWFPEDMTVGEGVALYFISVGFGLAYAAYWLGLTSIGLLVARWPMELFYRFDKKTPSHAGGYVFASFRLMWSSYVWIVAIATVIFIATNRIRLNSIEFVIYASIIGLQGVVGGLILIMHRRIHLDVSGLSLPDRLPDDAHTQNMSTLRRLMYSFLGIWVLLPMVLGLGDDALMSAAFRLAQLRKDHATVHVAAPWSQRVKDAGLKPHPSFLGAEYARFEGVTVRMRSIGSRIVLEVPGREDARYINIPQQFVEIE